MLELVRTRNSFTPRHACIHTRVPGARRLELEDAVHTALLTLKEGFEGAMDHTNIEVGIVGADGAFKVLTPAEIKDYLGEVE